MSDIYHGYVFSSSEVITILNLYGCQTDIGVPLPMSTISEEEQMRAVRTLLRKNIMRWDNGKYYLTDELERAFFDMISSNTYIKIMTRKFPEHGYLCYTSDKRLIVWDIDGNSLNKFVLYFMTAEQFIQMIKDDKYIAKTPEYFEYVPKGLSDMMLMELSRLARFDLNGSLRISTIISVSVKGCVDNRQYIVSNDISGSYFSIRNNDQFIHMEYKEAMFWSALENIIRGRAWDYDRS